MRSGYWMPIFGGWLRNVRDEGMPVSWPYLRDLAAESEQLGFALSLIAELNLNDIKGHLSTRRAATGRAPLTFGVSGGLMLLQFSPQREEMARFARDVIGQWPG